MSYWSVFIYLVFMPISLLHRIGRRWNVDGVLVARWRCTRAINSTILCRW